MLLKNVAERMTGCIRRCDPVSRFSKDSPSVVVARLGGDEFTVILHEINRTYDVVKVCHRILDNISTPFNIGGQEIFASASIGITIYPQDGGDIDRLLKNSDTAMYYSKKAGRNNYQFYNPSMNDSSLKLFTLENDLRKALERGEFLLHYQPIMSLPGREITAMESLIRWNNKERGLVAPAEFIPLAEETGLIAPIGEWVLNEACRQNKSWQLSGLNPVCVSVNISGVQLKTRDFINTVTSILDKTKLESKYLELEITESIMQNVEAARELMNKLNALGIKISIDDFGTGYSSLKYLKEFPINTLKIDKSFVKDLPDVSTTADIVKAMIAMAKALKLKVIAEGVETEGQLKFLSENGCGNAQGYLISQPLPPEDAESFLNRMTFLTVK